MAAAVRTIGSVVKQLTCSGEGKPTASPTRNHKTIRFIFLILSKLGGQRPPLQLFFRARKGMATELAAERVADLGNDLDLRRMIIFRILELLHGMLVIDRVRR
jgi:hypothetical protein